MNDKIVLVLEVLENIYKIMYVLESVGYSVEFLKSVLLEVSVILEKE